MVLGIIGLPIPDETILIFAGYLVSRHNLELIPTIIFSFLGSISGISISFILGRTLGLKVLNSLIKFVRIKQKKMGKTKKWLDSYGSWLFIFGYFIPGVRHLTAIVAGSTQIKYLKFVLYASIGGFLWSLTFILIGYYVGKKWMTLIVQIHNHIFLITLLILSLIILYFIFKALYSKKSTKEKSEN